MATSGVCVAAVVITPVVKCQKCCNPHGGVCHLTPNSEGSGGFALGFVWRPSCWQECRSRPRAPNQLLVRPRVADHFCDAATGRYVLSQRPCRCLYTNLPARPSVWWGHPGCILPGRVFCLVLISSPHAASFLWKWISHCFIKVSSPSVALTTTLFLCGGFWPVGGGPNRTQDGTIHNQGRKARKWLFLCNVIEKEKGKGYCSHLELVSFWYCTYQSYFMWHVLCVRWHFPWFIIVIIRTYCV